MKPFLYKIWLCLWICLNLVVNVNPSFGMHPGDESIVPYGEEEEGDHPVVSQQPKSSVSSSGSDGPVPGPGQPITMQPGPCNQPTNLLEGTGLNTKDPCAKCGVCAACGAMVCGCAGLAAAYVLGCPADTITTAGNVMMGVGTGVGGPYGCAQYAREYNMEIINKPRGHSEEDLQRAKDCVDCCTLCQSSVCSGCLGAASAVGVAACCGVTSAVELMQTAALACCCGSGLSVAASACFCVLGTRHMVQDTKEGVKEICKKCLAGCSKDEMAACCSTVPGMVKDSCCADKCPNVCTKRCAAACCGAAVGAAVGAGVAACCGSGCPQAGVAAAAGSAACCCLGASPQCSYCLKKGRKVCCNCCKKKTAKVITKQPTRMGEAQRMLGSGEAESAVLIPGYNHRAQASSLMALQGLLLGASDQVVSNLKSLVFRAYQGSTEEAFSTQLVEVTPKRRLRALQGLSRFSQGTIQGLKAVKPKASYNMFGFMDNYEANLERKVRSGRVGVSLSLMPKVKGTFAYNCSKQDSRKHEGFNFKQSKGSVKIRSATEGVSTAIVINPHDVGFTGHVASSYGWGTVKTHRHVRHGNALIRTKGSPESTLSGSLVQVGYNIPVTREHIITPYIENVFSRVSWKAYEERSHFVPCAISKNREQVTEKSIGLRHQWNVKQEQQLQTWISHITGQRHVSGLASRPLRSRNPLYEITIPHYKHRYSGTELGFAYQVAYTEDCTIGFNGTMRIQNTKKTDKQTYSCYMQYIF